MRRAATVLLAVYLGGCSVLFDPSKVDAGPAACPASPASCPARANTAASCSGAACVYACATGFVDGDGDLADGGTSGCEVDCRGNPGPPSNPSGLRAMVGPPQTVALSWSEANPRPDAYLVCIGPSAENCSPVPAGAPVCSGGICSLQLTVPENVRVTTRVSGLSFCAGPGPQATAPTVSYTTVNDNSYDRDTSTGCTTTVQKLVTAETEVTQSGGEACVTLLKLGDELWGDGTATVELMFPVAAQAPISSGVVLQANATTGHMVAAGLTARAVDRGTALTYRGSSAGNYLVGSSSIFVSPASVWMTLRLVATRGVFSLQVGPSESELRELIRWPSPVAGAPAQTGKFGLGVLGNGRVQFRNLRMSTAAALPPPGPTSAQWGGPAPGAEWTVADAPAGFAWGPCPAYGSASSCAGGCAPTGPNCAHITRGALNPKGSAVFDLPTGIDVARPWRLSFRFAATDAGVANPLAYPYVMTVTSSNVFNAGLLHAPGNWGSNLQTAGQDLGLKLETMRWHRAAWLFNPDAGVIEATVNGRAPVTVPRPAEWDRHPGALGLGAGYVIEMYVTDIEVSQP